MSIDENYEMIEQIDNKNQCVLLPIRCKTSFPPIDQATLHSPFRVIITRNTMKALLTIVVAVLLLFQLSFGDIDDFLSKFEEKKLYGEKGLPAEVTSVTKKRAYELLTKCPHLSPESYTPTCLELPHIGGKCQLTNIIVRLQSEHLYEIDDVSGKKWLFEI